MWGVARTAAEIAANYAKPLSGSETGLAGYWRFDEATGTTAADLAPAAAVATQRAIRATETKTFRFDAEEAEDYYFNLLSSAGNALSVRIYRPDGVLVNGPRGLGDFALSDLPQTGTYTVVVEGRHDNSGPAEFSAQLLKASDVATPLILGETASGEILAGQQAVYSFSLAAPRTVVFDSQTYNGSLYWSLEGPRGQEVNQQTLAWADSGYNSNDISLELPAGDYTLRIGGYGDTQGAYAFRLLDTASATAVTLGAETAGQLQPGSETDVYSFAASAGDAFDLSRIVNGGGGSAYFRVIDPSGRQVSGPTYFYDTQPFTVPMTGTYTLLIEGLSYASATEDYSFTLTKTGNTPPPNLGEGTPLTLGETVNGTLADAPALYSFTTSGPRTVYLDSLINASDRYWTLEGPRGIEVDSRAFAYSDAWETYDDLAVELPVAGTYQLRVSGAAGDYSFRLLDLASATPAAVDGELVSGALLPGRETDMFSFAGTAGEKIRLNVGTDANAAIRLIDPFGRQVVGPTSFTTQEFTLAATGTYTLLVEGRIYNGDDADDYAFSLVRPTATPPQALTLGETYEGTIVSSGDVHRYRFTVPADKLVVFDSLIDTWNVNWRLSGPRTQIGGSLYYGDSHERGTLPAALLEAGEYELEIGVDGSSAGEFRFRLLDLLAASTGLPAAGELTEALLSPARETDVYRFTAAAGERFSFDARTAPAYAAVRVIDPFGRDVSGPLNFSDSAFTAELAGTYYLLVEGRSWDNAAERAYGFVLDRPVDPAPAPLAIGATITAAITRPSEKVRLDFTLTEAGSYYLDSLTANGNLLWQLEGPTGVVASDDFYGSDSFEDYGERVLRLGAGNYRLTVSGNNATTGTANFRLLDLANATPLELGRPVSGANDPMQETDAYKLDLTKGQSVYFRALQSHPYASIRIIDPAGKQISSPAGLADR
ncbi:MAG: hypothetical protein C0489_10445, partial [Candidatus Accumulibacter sp.]|nr:hypothetical protein [Accumulibacter sp.]